VNSGVDNRLGFVNSLGVLEVVGLSNLRQEAGSVYGLNVDIRVDDGLGFVNSFGVLELRSLGDFLEKSVVVGHCVCVVLGLRCLMNLNDFFVLKSFYFFGSNSSHVKNNQ
jgi:hypothetical protein